MDIGWDQLTLKKRSRGNRQCTGCAWPDRHVRRFRIARRPRRRLRTGTRPANHPAAHHRPRHGRHHRRPGLNQAAIGYDAGKVSGAALVAAVPGLDKLATISAEQISSIGSQDMNDTVWFTLAHRISDIFANNEADGVVITHGTDTMEETAFFLSEVLNSAKPVVLVGSMRPSTAVSADGPANLYEAVEVAASPQAAGRGVMVVLNDTILAPRSVQKSNTTSVQTFIAPNAGPIGYVDPSSIRFLTKTVSGNAPQPYALPAAAPLPRVDIIYAHANMDAALIEDAVKGGAKGLVLAGVATATAPRPPSKPSPRPRSRESSSTAPPAPAPASSTATSRSTTRTRLRRGTRPHRQSVGLDDNRRRHGAHPGARLPLIPENRGWRRRYPVFEEDLLGVNFRGLEPRAVGARAVSGYPWPCGRWSARPRASGTSGPMTTKPPSRGGRVRQGCRRPRRPRESTRHLRRRRQFLGDQAGVPGRGDQRPDERMLAARRRRRPGPSWAGRGPPLQHLELSPVVGHDFLRIVREQDVLGHPGRRALCADHVPDLAAQVGEELRVEEHKWNAGPDAQLQIAKLDPYLLQCPDAADVEYAKVGDLEPFLPEMARRRRRAVGSNDAGIRRTTYLPAAPARRGYRPARATPQSPRPPSVPPLGGPAEPPLPESQRIDVNPRLRRRFRRRQATLLPTRHMCAPLLSCRYWSSTSADAMHWVAVILSGTVLSERIRAGCQSNGYACLNRPGTLSRPSKRVPERARRRRRLRIVRDLFATAVRNDPSYSYLATSTRDDISVTSSSMLDRIIAHVDDEGLPGVHSHAYP